MKTYVIERIIPGERNLSAENKSFIQEHAKKGGFPLDFIIEVKTIISPESAKLWPYIDIFLVTC